MQNASITDPSTISKHAAPAPKKFQQALALHQAGQLDQARAIYEEILVEQPAHADTANLLGTIAVQTGDLPRAVELLDRALRLDPANVAALSNSALALMQMRRFEAALQKYDQAIALKPDIAEVYFHRGNVLGELKQYEAALASYQRAIEIEADYAEAYTSAGRALRELGRSEEALASCERAIALVADYEEAYLIRGTALADLKRLDEALDSFDQAIAIKSGFVDARLNRSLTLLLRGEFDKGWTDYEWRLKNDDGSFKDNRGFTQPWWRGQEAIAGKTILLHAEQGLGDTLQFCRYVKAVAKLGARVILEVQPPLSSLLASLEGTVKVIGRGQALPEFDYRCALLSLPLAFKTRLQTIPASARYLNSEPAKVAQWRARLGPRSQLRVGLVWSGSLVHRDDHKRSIALAQMIEHLPVGVQCVSLQKDVREGDRQRLQSHPAILQFAEELHDFTDTAALCECVDLVISVDTSVAHLSGALGKPTWVLLPWMPDWRWMLDRQDSPWYPSVKLYRQDRPGDWNQILERVRADLILNCSQRDSTCGEAGANG